jgi:hypothetical protein
VPKLRLRDQRAHAAQEAILALWVREFGSLLKCPHSFVQARRIALSPFRDWITPWQWEQSRAGAAGGIEIVESSKLTADVDEPVTVGAGKP